MSNEIRNPKSEILPAARLPLALDDDFQPRDARFVVAGLALELQLVAGDVVDPLQNPPGANPHRRHPGDKPAQRGGGGDPFLRSHGVSLPCETRETASADSWRTLRSAVTKTQGRTLAV